LPSTCVKHKGHSSGHWTKRFLKRVRVGKQSLQILQSRCLALGGVCIFQMLHQPSTLLGPYPLLLSFIIFLYRDLTE
jgi:hypothetical protein